MLPFLPGHCCISLKSRTNPFSPFLYRFDFICLKQVESCFCSIRERCYKIYILHWLIFIVSSLVILIKLCFVKLSWLLILICDVQGFKRVYNVSGGIHAYAQKADPTIPTYWYVFPQLQSLVFLSVIRFGRLRKWFGIICFSLYIQVHYSPIYVGQIQMLIKLN